MRELTLAIEQLVSEQAHRSWMLQLAWQNPTTLVRRPGADAWAALSRTLRRHGAECEPNLRDLFADRFRQALESKLGDHLAYERGRRSGVAFRKAGHELEALLRRAACGPAYRLTLAAIAMAGHDEHTYRAKLIELAGLVILCSNSPKAIAFQRTVLAALARLIHPKG